MNQILFRSQTGYKVSFDSLDLSSDTVPNLHLLGSYLPGVSITDDNSRIDFQITHIESSTPRLENIGNHLTIYDSWQGKISLDLWHLLYSIFRLNYINNHLYPIHASCLGREKNILLVAHSGMGKTTLTLRLINDLHWQVFSGNKTIIDFSSGINAVAGTKTISIRSDDSAKYPNLLSNSSVFSDRQAFDLPQSYISPLPSVPISAIFQIKIDDGQDILTEINSPSNLHLLYPYFLDTIYADTVLCGGLDVFSGEVSNQEKNNLSRSLSRELKNIKVYSLKGSVNYMVDQIKLLS